MDAKRKRMQGNILIIIGLLLLAAALILVARNVINDMNAGKHSDELMEVIHEEFLDGATLTEYVPGSTASEEVPDYVKFPDMSLPVLEYEGRECVGILQIPAMGKEFPVMNELTDWNLRYGPCLYSGSPYKNTLVIGAHNNSTHFGGLIRDVVVGDTITFIDMAGHLFAYIVAEIEVLQPFESDRMKNSEWDLSLFTCTWDLGARHTVRCVLSSSDVNVITIE